MGKTFKKNDRHVKFNKHDNLIPNRFKKNHGKFFTSNSDDTDYDMDDFDAYEFDQDENN